MGANDLMIQSVYQMGPVVDGEMLQKYYRLEDPTSGVAIYELEESPSDRGTGGKPQDRVAIIWLVGSMTGITGP